MRLSAGGLVFVLASVAVAHADINTGSIDVSPPWVQAIVTTERRPMAELELHDHEVTIPATQLREPPIAIAIVYEGQEIWIGNDEYELDDAAKYPGALNALIKAVDDSSLRKAGPPGSKIVVVTYATGAELRLAATDLASLTGSAFGNQREYRSHLGSDLLQGVTLALDQLVPLNTARKVMIVVGDGNDTNNDLAAPAFAELRQRAKDERVDTYAIVYKSPLSAETSIVGDFVAGPKTVQSLSALRTELESIVAQLGNGSAVVFDARELDWDGKAHTLSVFSGGHQVLSASVLLPVWGAPSSPWTAPWRWAVIVVGLVALVALGFLLRSRLRSTA
jgi:hypothetical protein